MSQMMRGKSCLVAAAALALAGVAGCEKPGPAETAGKKMDMAIDKLGEKVDQTAQVARLETGKAAQAIDDASITAAIKAGILAEPGLKVLNIEVDTTAGVVTLTGSADSAQSVERAAEIAGKIPGVKWVDNRLALSTRG